jgi:Predicted nucleotide-binding protein containing TIR-like domain
MQSSYTHLPGESIVKQIFVGSSSHGDAETYARVVYDQLAVVDPKNVKPVYWRDSFPLGLATFEALEQMLRTCSGAVLVATPEIEGQPNENVMLEFGLVAGRMGRTSVVLCKHPEAKVPSDLLSLTFVELNAKTEGNSILSNSGAGILKRWALGLPERIQGVPSTRIVHGYTGRWSVFLRFDRWRQIQISGRNVGTFEGSVDLIIPPEGKNGFGLATAEVFVHLDETASGNPPFEVRYRICAQVSEVECPPSGELVFRSRTLSRQLTNVSGKPWPEEGLGDEEAGPYNFVWRMLPNPENDRFIVTLKTDSSEWTSATGELRRDIGHF